MADATLLLSEIEAGHGLTLTQATRFVPNHRDKGCANTSTIFRWVTKGVRGLGGRLVLLEAVRLGAKWITTRPALARFADALSAIDGPSPKESAATRSMTRLRRASVAAGEQLERLGV